MDRTWLQERIDACKLLIVAYEDVLSSLALNSTKSYTLNTGQTVETVTKKDEATLNRALDGLLNRLATMEARLNGGSVMILPGW